MKRIIIVTTVLFLSHFVFCQIHEIPVDLFFNDKKIKLEENKLKVYLVRQSDHGKEIYIPKFDNGNLILDDFERLKNTSLVFFYKRHYAVFRIESFNFNQSLRFTVSLKNKRIEDNIKLKMELIVEPLQNGSGITYTTNIQNKKGIKKKLSKLIKG